MCAAPETIIDMADTSVTVTASIEERVIILSADDGAAETCLDLAPVKVRRLIAALTDALRHLED